MVRYSECQMAWRTCRMPLRRQQQLQAVRSAMISVPSTSVLLLLALVLLSSVSLAEGQVARQPGWRKEDGGCCGLRNKFCANSDSQETCLDMYICLDSGAGDKGENRVDRCDTLTDSPERMEYDCGVRDCETERKEMCEDPGNQAKCEAHNTCTGNPSDSDQRCSSGANIEAYQGELCQNNQGPPQDRCRKEMDAWCDDVQNPSRCDDFNTCAGYTFASDCNSVNIKDLKYFCGECDDDQSRMCTLLNENTATDLEDNDEWNDVCPKFLKCRGSLNLAVSPGEPGIACAKPNLELLGQYCECKLTTLQLILIVGGSLLGAAIIILAVHRYIVQPRRQKQLDEARAAGKSKSDEAGSTGSGNAGNQAVRKTSNGAVAEAYRKDSSGASVGDKPGDRGRSASQSSSAAAEAAAAAEAQAAAEKAERKAERKASRAKHGSRGSRGSKAHRSRGHRHRKQSEQQTDQPAGGD